MNNFKCIHKKEKKKREKVMLNRRARIQYRTQKSTQRRQALTSILTTRHGGQLVTVLDC